MSQTLHATLAKLKQSEALHFITGIKHGFEKECLRVNKKGILAETPHPQGLGSSLTHPMITTDYSEALLEFITPPTENVLSMFQTLTELHQYTYQILEQAQQGEYLWTASMPCALPAENQIPIAEFGSSNLGQVKYIYRNGLGLRYGRTMQTIAGIHYNFSLPHNFWQSFQSVQNSNLPLSAFISEQYLNIIRNAMRFEWLLPWLYGASPAICSSFLKNEREDLEFFGKHTLIGPYATSLRLSDLGYHNKKQFDNYICFNSLDKYLKTMHQAVHTVEPEFARLGVLVNGEYRQLSDCRLQIEDEHYASFRPKRVTAPEERMLGAIAREGIEYIEIRALDIDPLLMLGVDPQTVYVIDTFLLYCLLRESPPLTEEDNKRIRHNHTQVVNWGRKPDLKLKNEQDQPCTLVDYAQALFAEMEPIAELLDRAYNTHNFKDAIKGAQSKLTHFQDLPSAKVITEMKKHEASYFEFVKRCSGRHEAQFKASPLSATQYQTLVEMATQSKVAQSALEAQNAIPFSQYLANFLAI